MKSKERFEVVNKIGEGTYGLVYKVRDVVTKWEYAMKVIKMDKDYQIIS